MHRTALQPNLAPRLPTSEPGDIGAPAGDASLDDAAESGPLRRCIVTRSVLPRERMLRFVVGPGAVIVPDLAARLPGRGIWLSAQGDVVEIARTKGAFSRAARCKVAVPPDLLGLLQAGLARRVGDLLGLARRAGQTVCGFHKAGEWLQTGRAALVVQACDGSAQERRRFVGGQADVPVVTPLPAQALGAVFGREHVVHVAVSAGRLAATLVIECERLSGLSGKPFQQQAGI